MHLPPSADTIVVGEPSAIVGILGRCETDVPRRGRVAGAGEDEWAAARDVPTKEGVRRELWLTMRTIEELSIRFIGSANGSIKVDVELLGWVK